MIANQLLFIMLAHILWVVALYVLLTVCRAPKIWGLKIPQGFLENRKITLDSLEKKVSANLSNQFEWPIFFHVASAMLIVQPSLISHAQIILGWLFIGGRILHTLVQVFTDNIRLRGLIFTINFVAVLGLWFSLVKQSVS